MNSVSRPRTLAVVLGIPPLAGGLLILAGCGGEPSAWDGVPLATAHTDHSTFFVGAPDDGPSVTRACLECHPNSAEQVMVTSHWTWRGEVVEVAGRTEPVAIGKANLINNFCIGIRSNEPRCTSCHAGYGWADDSFDFDDPTLVDCLICHADTGLYRKEPTGAGLPAQDVDLLAAARSVGVPTRANCGVCHFRGGGGDAVKHGDLDGSMYFPSERVDVHMGRLDLSCQDCHKTLDHRIKGRTMSVRPDEELRIGCVDCHRAEPHASERLNGHVSAVSCEACHIPFMAKDRATKMEWDWSTAGQDLGIDDPHVYSKKKGSFVYESRVVPEYAWYDGGAERYLLGDPIDPAAINELNPPRGSVGDRGARIWPFKIHRGRQVYDSVHETLMIPRTFGEGGYWTEFDWDRALRIGAERTGLDYSGAYDFAATSMYWPLTHMVSPKEDALACTDCHGDRGRLDWIELGYRGDPVHFGGRRLQDATSDAAAAGVTLATTRPGMRPRPAARGGSRSTVDEAFDHTEIELLDASGDNFMASGLRISATVTCGECHELEGLVGHSGHDRLAGSGSPHALVGSGSYGRSGEFSNSGNSGKTGELGEQDCFVCHLSRPIDEVGTDEVAADGTVDPGLLGLGHVGSAACGRCHGVVYEGEAPLWIQPDLNQRMTATRGEIFAAQRMSDSALNLEGKNDLRRPWDVHASRLLGCTSCHFTPNPVDPGSASGDARPSHLVWDPRRSVEDGSVGPGDEGRRRRRCDGCHSVDTTHEWLDEKDAHMASLDCESCHVSRVHFPALIQVDATVVSASGEARARWRGVDGPTDDPRSFIRGYEPALLARAGSETGRRAPFNLVSEWRWVSGSEEAEIPADVLRAAYFGDDGASGSADDVAPRSARRAGAGARGATRDSGYHPAIVAALDDDGDDRLAEAELALDTEAKATAVADRLAALGVSDPRIVGTVRAAGIHHDVAPGGFALRDCDSCHGDRSRMNRGTIVADYLPGGVRPRLETDGEALLDGSFELLERGRLVYIPAARELARAAH